MTNDEDPKQKANKAAQDIFNSAVPYLGGMEFQQQSGTYGPQGSKDLSVLYANVMHNAKNDSPVAGILGDAHAAAADEALKSGKPFSGVVTDGQITSTAYAAMYGQQGSIYAMRIGELLKATDCDDGEVDPAIKDMYLADALQSTDKRTANIAGFLLQDAQKYFLQAGMSQALALTARTRKSKIEQMVKTPDPKDKK